MRPQNIQIIGNELCIVWPDGGESYFPAEFLRRHSPSAENIGEKDIFGNQYGGGGPKEFPGVTIERYDPVGNYAIRPTFSDGHASGIFSWTYLRELADKL
ncbi:MAG: gamma-butyrobetaine hydroxylase-like domain-containing protein [Verrucomicrobiota bacterium]